MSCNKIQKKKKLSLCPVALGTPCPVKVAAFVFLIKWVFTLKSPTAQRKQHEIKMSFVFCFSIICVEEALGLYQWQWKVALWKRHSTHPASVHGELAMATASGPHRQIHQRQGSRLSFTKGRSEERCLELLEKCIASVGLFLNKQINK